MLKRLKLRNFKNWQEADIAFGRITGLFGTNSSGKSSLAQFLLLLKQTKESSDLAATLDLNGRFVRLGIAADAIHGHDESHVLDFELGFDPETQEVLAPSNRLGEDVTSSRDLAVGATVEIHRGAFRSRTLTHRIGKAEFTMRRGEGNKFDLVATIPDRDFSLTRTKGRPWKLPSPVKAYGFPDQVSTYYQNVEFLTHLERVFEDELDKLYYLGPLRDHPQRDYLWAGSRPADVGAKGERTVDAILAAQAADEKQNLGPRRHHHPFSYIVAHWLRELGLIADFKVEEIARGSNRWQAKVRTVRGGAKAMLTDVGFGVSQVLPVIVLLHYVPKGSTVILEQPEIHLHPLAQAGLADVVIHAAIHRKVQVVLESHSEHLLLRLQRRIAEEKIDSDDVTLYFCNMLRKTSRIERLDLNMFGDILNWPDRFMGDAFMETAKAELARLGRMRNAAE